MSGSIDQRLPVSQSPLDALVLEAHSTYLEPHAAAPATEGQSMVFTPSTTTATLPTPEATHIQFTGIECYNPLRFIFYPISWDEPDNLLVTAEIEPLLSDLDTAFEQLSISPEDPSDPLSAVPCAVDDPFDSIDHWRRNVVNSVDPWHGPFEPTVDAGDTPPARLAPHWDECGRPHNISSQTNGPELDLTCTTDRRPRIRTRSTSLPA